MIKSGKLADLTVEDTQRNYKKALEKGVLKILSKMGISLLSCYHGAQIFEIYGLGEDIVDTAFRGSVSRIGGMTFDDLQKEVESFWVKVSGSCPLLRPTFPLCPIRLSPCPQGRQTCSTTTALSLATST